MAPQLPVVVCEVWQDNLEQEFRTINDALLRYPLIAIDTEFPGTIYSQLGAFPGCAHSSQIAPAFRYQVMKANVDATKIIQLGLSLCDAEGNLPNLGNGCCYVWEFNFRDFDFECDLQNPDSINLLESQGTDFAKNREKGIDSRDFARLIRSSGMLFGESHSWITFHGDYDFGYLLKILMNKPLPSDLATFMRLVKNFFGPKVYDLKHMIKFCGGLSTRWGLERVSKVLRVDRSAGKNHQAGSDSLLTLQTFLKLKDVYFKDNNDYEYFLKIVGLVIHLVSI